MYPAELESPAVERNVEKTALGVKEVRSTRSECFSFDFMVEVPYSFFLNLISEVIKIRYPSFFVHKLNIHNI